MNGISAAQGIQNWLGVFDRAATTVTRSTTPVSDPSAPNTSDSLIDGMVGLNESAAGLHAAIAVFKTEDEMLGSVIDMLA